MKIVDTHVHVWELASGRFPWQPIGKLRPDFQWTIEQQVAAMEQNNIACGIIVQTSWYGYDNRYGIDCLRRYPGRFAFVGMVDPAREDIENEMERLANQGVGGLRLPVLLRPDLPWYGTPQTDRMWRQAGELEWVLCLLVTLEQVLEARRTIEQFPQVKIAIDHIAHPDLETPPGGSLFAQLLKMANLPNVYVKVSALAAISRLPYPHRDVLEQVKRAFDAFGPQRLMWGTDHAMTQKIRNYSLQQALNSVDTALKDASPEDRAWVKGGTATRVWKLDCAG